MRNIRRKLKVRDIEVTVYDSAEKKEKTITASLSEVEEGVKVPEGCAVISEKVINEREVIFRMSPQTFVEHAEIIEE